MNQYIAKSFLVLAVWSPAIIWFLLTKKPMGLEIFFFFLMTAIIVKN